MNISPEKHTLDTEPEKRKERPQRIVECIIRDKDTGQFFRGYHATFDGLEVKTKIPTWTHQLLNAALFAGINEAQSECRTLKLPIRSAMSLAMAKTADGWPRKKAKKKYW